MPNGRKRDTATTRKNKFAFFALYGYTITKVWTLRILENNIVDDRLTKSRRTFCLQRFVFCGILYLGEVTCTGLCLAAIDTRHLALLKRMNSRQCFGSAFSSQGVSHAQTSSQSHFPNSVGSRYLGKYL